MNIKKFFGLLMILAVSIFAFTACSSDDDDEKTGTFEYALGYSSFEGNFEDMQKISDAFNQAFGVTDKTFKLTGTQSECDRKAKEYAMKAQAALANEGSFGATVNFTNVTTGELILSFNIKMDDNGFFFKANIKLSRTGITLSNMKGFYVDMEYSKVMIFKGYLETNEETFDLKSLAPKFFLTTDDFNQKVAVIYLRVIDKSTRQHGDFILYYTKDLGLQMSVW